MNWFTGKRRPPSKGVLLARAALDDADRRLREAEKARTEAEKTRRVSENVKLSLQELRARDHFTPTIFPRR